MVTCRRYGRIGNGLFQIATVIGYAKSHGLEFTVPSTTNDEFWNPVIMRHLINPKYDPSLPNISLREKSHAYNILDFSDTWRGCNIVLDGYFQSPLYFDLYRDEIIKYFGFDHNCSHTNAISIHQRRGDYLQYPDKHPVMTKQFLRQAIDIFNKAGFKNFMVFSDDMPYTKTNINDTEYPGNFFGYQENESDIENLRMMSMCDGHIIAASSFSWWGAWLSHKKDKIVVTPDESTWFGPSYSNLDLSTLLPKDWVRIKY